MFRYAVAVCLIGCAFFVPGMARAADTLQDYAKKCDAAIGATVPKFNCDLGTEVPEGSNNGQPYGWGLICDRPNVLNHECDPGSHFKVLLNDENASIVAHCRKQIDKTSDDGKYGDIAVIQYSKKNGATCFYQALAEGGPRLAAQMPAPSTGSAPWFSPTKTAGIHCGECHDNGPFVRSPYLAQLKDIAGAADVLPGSHDGSFNSTQPYAFVGDDFKTWKAYSIEISGNTCNDCHRMGVSNMAFKDVDPSHPSQGGGGTGRVLGIIATARSQSHKNAHSASSPIWMTPGQITFDQGNADDAKAIRECALKFVANGFDATKPLPAKCTVKKFAGAF